jgi:hypothetical protein
MFELPKSIFVWLLIIAITPISSLFIFWCFWLTIQNTTTSQARSLFRVIAVFISFCLARAPLLGETPF